MRYLGGKSRLAAQLAPFLETVCLYEPFVGAFNIVPAVRPHSAVCSDIHAGLIGLYHAVQRGWAPPDRITEADYVSLKRERDGSPLSVFASFAASFGGKEWGGFARDATGRRDLTAEGATAFRKKIPFIRSAQFRCVPFEAVYPCPGATLYCDPPYAGTTGYRTIAFNQTAFVAWCNKQADRGCRVFVSEFTNPCPDRWRVAWSRERATSLEKGASRKTELLLEVAN